MAKRTLWGSRFNDHFWRKIVWGGGFSNKQNLHVFFGGFGKFPTNHFWDQLWNEDRVIKQLGFNGEFHGSHYWEFLESLPFSPGTFVRQVVLLSHLWISAFCRWMGTAQRVEDFLRLGDTTETRGGKKGKWWEVCFVKVCKNHHLRKNVWVWFDFFFRRWLLWNKVRITFQRFDFYSSMHPMWDAPL